MTPSSVAPPYPRGHVLKGKKLEICTSSKRLHINFNFLGLNWNLRRIFQMVYCISLSKNVIPYCGPTIPQGIHDFNKLEFSLSEDDASTQVLSFLVQ